MAYSVQAGKVRYAGKVVRGADADSFSILTGGHRWALDSKQVYYAGLKVAGADPATFAAHGDSVGADAQKLFYLRANQQKPTSAKKPKGLGPDLEVLRSGSQLVLKSGGAAYPALRSGIGPALAVHAASFTLIGRGYARDDHRIYWFDLQGLPAPIPDADIDTFAVVGSLVSDKDGRYLNGQRDAHRLPIEDQAATRETLELMVAESFKLLLPRYFTLFDGTLPNDVGNPPGVGSGTTKVPDYTLALDGALDRATVLVAVEDQAYRGQISSMEHIAAWMYGAARHQRRGGTTCLRVVPKACSWPAAKSDAAPHWHRQLDLAYVLEHLGEHEESRLLAAQVLREQRALPRTGDVTSDPRLRTEKLVPHVLDSLPGPVSAQGTTTQAAIKWIVKQELHLSEDSVTRRNVAAEMLAITRDTSAEPARLAALCAPLLCLLEDPQHTVRSHAAVAFDLLASKLFHYRAYTSALSAATALSAGGFNLDIQLARRWECLAAAGRDEEAEEAWAGATALDRPGQRAPRQHTGLHTDYPSLEAWRAFGELRLAEAHRCAARGESPNAELRRKQQPLKVSAENAAAWSSRAAERVAAATLTIERLAHEEPAAEIGMILAEFAEQSSRVTGKDPVTGHEFVMHSQYVDYRRYGIPYRSDGGTILFAGEFESAGSHSFRALRAGQAIPCSLGRAFGLEFRFAGGPPGRRLPASVRVERPAPSGAVQVDDYPVLVFLGLRENFVFILESPDELAIGTWKISITLLSAPPPTDYPCRGKLTPGAPLATLHQTFELVPPAPES